MVKVDGINHYIPSPPNKSISVGEGGKAGDANFGNLFQKALQSTNETALKADATVEAFAAGDKNVSVHQVMLELQKADIEVRMFTGVVNKALEAYRDITHIQV